MRLLREWHNRYKSLNPRFNLPTKLTVLRIGLSPIFFITLMNEDLISRYFALFFFIAAAISDAYDGYIARKDGLVTQFGKIIDPIADKLLISIAFIAFYLLDLIPSLWIIVVILIREYFITLLRIIGVFKNVIIAADKWGKYKTIFQMTYIITLLVYINLIATLKKFGYHLPFIWSDIFNSIIFLLLFLALILTLWSGLNYVIQNRGMIKELFQ